MKRISDKDRILGSMVGGAVGDALGYAVEFISWNEITGRYGAQGITRYELNRQGVAEISDDTQMSLFVACGLMNGDTYIADKGLGSPHGYDWAALKAWYLTQIQTFDTPREKRWNCFWLLDEPRLYVRRAPGMTCMRSLSGQYPENDSKGCGGIMRIAPLALYEYQFSGLSREQKWENAREMVEYTHNHPLAWMPAVLLVDVLCKIMHGAAESESLEGIVRESALAMEDILANEHGRYLVALVEKAFSLAKDNGVPDHDAIEQLGGGWTAEETLAIALYCVAKYPTDFERAIVASVNHSGDSDSTGSVTGNIIGAMLGRGAIPQHYIDNLELIDVIEEMANDVASGAQICYHAPATEAEELWAKKYIRSIF